MDGNTCMIVRSVFIVYDDIVSEGAIMLYVRHCTPC